MMRGMVERAAAIAVGMVMMACSAERLPEASKPVDEPTARKEEVAVDQLTYTVVATLPHDDKSFTQGLVVDDGHFLETTGQVGKSTLRRVNIATGKVEKSIPLESHVFGEGMTVKGDEIFVLTWLHQRGYVFDRRTFEKRRTFSYSGEGWGLTTDGNNLYMSNGTNVITVHDPSTFAVLRSLPVTLSGRPLGDLNELEWIDGMIWANVWRTDLIVRIDPSNGKVTAVADLTGLLPFAQRTVETDVLNGIAWDAANKALYVTGKNWPHVYRIDVRRK
jgi:glutamine cyclotransferase